jgi:hypothetical protein
LFDYFLSSDLNPEREDNDTKTVFLPWREFRRTTAEATGGTIFTSGPVRGVAHELTAATARR